MLIDDGLTAIFMSNLDSNSNTLHSQIIGTWTEMQCFESIVSNIEKTRSNILSRMVTGRLSVR